jgi:hypothetical protein
VAGIVVEVVGSGLHGLVLLEAHGEALLLDRVCQPAVYRGVEAGKWVWLRSGGVQERMGQEQGMVVIAGMQWEGCAAGCKGLALWHAQGLTLAHILLCFPVLIAHAELL